MPQSKYEPVMIQSFPTGIQRIFDFGNGYGASLWSFAYNGTLLGTADIAVITFKDDGSWDVVEDLIKPVTPDTVEKMLDEIAALPIKR